MDFSSAMSRRRTLAGALGLPAAVAGLVPSGAAAAPQTIGSGPLVAYYSRTGNTRVIAEQIRRAHRADIFAIVTAVPYPEDYQETVRQAESERRSGYEPPLAATVPSIAAYRVVFLGFPIWGMTAPAVIRSFLSRHALAGKTLVPFITHGGYGAGNSLEVIAKHTPGADLRDAFMLRQDQERETLAQVTAWLGDVKLSR
jgi:flavodoxin